MKTTRQLAREKVQVTVNSIMWLKSNDFVERFAGIMVKFQTIYFSCDMNLKDFQRNMQVNEARISKINSL